LALVWVAWSLLTLLSLIDFISSIREYLVAVQTLCHPGSCVAGQPTPETAQILHRLGLSVGAYAALGVGLVIGAGLVYGVVAAVLVWRKPTDWMVLLTTSMLITQGLFEDNYLQSLFDQPSSPWHVAGLLLSFLSPVQFLFFCAFFPNGRSVPRWMGWLLVALSLLDLPPNFFPTLPLGDLIETLFIFSGFPLIVGSMIYRYRRVSTPVERQQTKWVVFGVTVVICAFMVWFVPQIIVFSSLSQPGSVYDLIGHPLFTIAALFGPICIAIAILRYRLWDIDAIINKALVYGSLTALLGALYAGLILGLEALAGAIIGGDVTNQPAALVISTLVIAALFLPVRRRIQALIDRRFYRKQYDAEKTLAAFSATLRNEVDLEQLRAQLLAVVQETMQPTHVSLWLRSPERHVADMPHRLEPQGPAPTKPSDGWGEAQLEERALIMAAGMEE
jgi:hypothetical protein